MFERFTDRARRVVARAHREATQLNHDYIGSEHLLLALIDEGSCIGAQVLKNLGIGLDVVRARLEKVVTAGLGGPVPAKLPQTSHTRRIIQLAVESAQRLKHDHVGTEHLLLGILAEPDGIAGQVLVNLGADPDAIQAAIARFEADRALGAALSPAAVHWLEKATESAVASPPPIGASRSSAAAPKRATRESAERLTVLGVEHRLFLTGADTAGLFTLLEVAAPAGPGIPPHTHRNEDEVFVVLSGEVEFTIGDAVYPTTAGTTVFAPRGVPHTFRIGEGGARILVAVYPAGIERMFTELAALPAGLPDMRRVAEICEKYGVSFGLPK